jgi:DNA-binding MarR family transcriptional regulator
MEHPAMTNAATTRSKRPASRASAKRQDLPAVSAVDQVDTSYLQSLLGYNARRAALTIIEGFLERMAEFGLRPVDFSVMSVIQHNPGVTSRQLCAALNLLPPNLVGLIQSLEARGLIHRQPHPTDGRAWGLHLTPAGESLLAQAESRILASEQQACAGLSTAEQATLKQLLQKIYLS